jgi:hypothetical protein
MFEIIIARAKIKREKSKYCGFPMQKGEMGYG